MLLESFSKFMDARFSTLAMGFVPSGHIHLGFLTTLACALLYLREHPSTRLIITSTENATDWHMNKYNYRPVRVQQLGDGLEVPLNLRELKKRDTAAHRVMGELKDLIWKLGSHLDRKTKQELRSLHDADIPRHHKHLLASKENSLFHLYGSPVHVYSFIEALRRDRGFRNKMIHCLTDPDFVAKANEIVAIHFKEHIFGSGVIHNGKKYRPRTYQVPLRLYCPTCLYLCPDWASVMNGHPLHPGPTMVALCKNERCERARGEQGYDGYVYYRMADALHNAEFHFLLDPMRDFFSPFEADCHVFGGDYTQMTSRLGYNCLDKIGPYWSYLEHKTGRSRYIFTGPMVMMDGQKMAKSDLAFNVKDVARIGKVFENIISHLEHIRARNLDGPLKVEYERIIA